MTRQCSVIRLLSGITLAGALTAGTLVAAPAAGAATPQNTAYVRSLYLDLLDRTTNTGDDAGVAYWANRLDTDPVHRFVVVRSLMKAGSEYYGNIVDINYAVFLDRSPDPGGRSFYVQGWRNRTITLEAVVVALGSSGEYFDRVGGTNEAFIDAIYFDVLGREADESGRSFGLDFISERGRDQYVALLVRSVEKRRQVVDDAYGNFLGRLATVAERNEAVSSLAPGRVRREDFDAALVSGDEYYDANSG